MPVTCIIFSILFWLIVFIIWRLFKKSPIFNISASVANNITMMQITISLISITIMELFLNSADDRIMGISYKRLFCKNFIWKVFNLINCIYFMLLLMTVSMLASIVLFYIEMTKSISQITLMTALCFTTILMFHMINLGLVCKYKKSQIYNIIYKCFEKKRKGYDELYEKIICYLNYDVEKKYNEYIREEVMILSYLYLNLEKFEDNIGKRRIIRNQIIVCINKIITNDPRNNQYLAILLYEELIKTFNKGQVNTLFWRE